MRKKGFVIGLYCLLKWVALPCLMLHDEGQTLPAPWITEHCNLGDAGRPGFILQERAGKRVLKRQCF